MASEQMTKITRALSKWGVIDIGSLSHLSGVPRSNIYDCAKRKAATFTIHNAIVYPKLPEIVEKDGTVNKECDKPHLPDWTDGLGIDVMSSEKYKKLEEALVAHVARDNLVISESFRKMADSTKSDIPMVCNLPRELTQVLTRLMLAHYWMDSETGGHISNGRNN